MYLDQGEPSEKCGELNFGLEYDFATQTLKLKIIQVRKSLFAQCLKITEKVSFNIVSEASYVYILNGQKLIKKAKNGPIWRVFENLKLAVKKCY